MFQKNLIIILSLISLFDIISNQNECSSIKPNIKYDCYKYSAQETFCCYNSIGKNCTSIYKNDIKNNPGLDCGISEENYGLYEFEEYHPKQPLDDLPFQTCGEKEPKKKQDCLEYSEISNSCCFFKEGGKTGCYYIGRKYTNDLNKKSFTYNDRKIAYECYFFYINFKFYLIFFWIFIFF